MRRFVLVYLIKNNATILFSTHNLISLFGEQIRFRWKISTYVLSLQDNVYLEPKNSIHY